MTEEIEKLAKYIEENLLPTENGMEELQKIADRLHLYSDLDMSQYADNVTSSCKHQLEEKDKQIADLKIENEHQKNLLQVMNDNDEQLRQTIKELKAQIPQWHDLRKDPNDLPNTDREVICKIMTSNLDIYGTVIDSFIKIGSKRIWNNTPNIPKVAWCEIPQFKEN